ncbi:hypothetical protein ACMFMG_012218 [Clarireedia jacksonii]
MLPVKSLTLAMKIPRPKNSNGAVLYLQQLRYRQPVGGIGRGRSLCIHILLGRAVVTRTLLGRSFATSSLLPISTFRRRFRLFCCGVLSTASPALAETSLAELICFFAGRSFSLSSSSDTICRFLLCGVLKVLSADIDGVGSISAWCGLRGRSGADTVFPRPTALIMLLPPLCSLLSLSLSSSEVTPAISSQAFNSASSFSLISVGVCPIGHSSAALWYIAFLAVCATTSAWRCI